MSTSPSEIDVEVEKLRYRLILITKDIKRNELFWYAALAVVLVLPEDRTESRLLLGISTISMS
jgi:hypothetical protein